MKPRRTPPWWVRLRLHLDSLDRYHAWAVLVLATGVLGGLLFATIVGPHWAWVGFCDGVVMMFVLIALAYPFPD